MDEMTEFSDNFDAMVEEPAGGDTGAEELSRQEGAEPESKPEAQPTETDGTAEVEGEAKPETKEEPKGASLPKELEPFKDLLDTRKWDLSKPEGIAQVIKAYKEVEQFAQRSQGQANNANQKAIEAARAATGSLDDINKFRERQGMPKLEGPKPIEERQKEVETLFGDMDKALKGDDEALGRLNAYFQQQKLDLHAQKALAGVQKTKTADEVFHERKVTAKSNFATVLQQNPDARTYIDELTSYFDKGGAFDSLQIDVLDAASTPERLQEFIELGQAMHFYRNMDKIVADKVKAELGRTRKAGNAGEVGGGRATSESPGGDVLDEIWDFANQ